LLVGLEDDLRLLTVQGLGVAELNLLEEIGRSQLVQLAAVVFQVQPVGDVATKDQVVRLKAVLNRNDGDQLGLRPVDPGDSRRGARAQANATTSKFDVPRFGWCLTLASVSGRWMAA